LLAGCSETNSTLPRSNAGTSSTRLGKLTPTLAQSPGGGGAFSGGYSGTANFRPCVYQQYTGQFKFTGAGAVSFLGQSEESGNLVLSGRRGSCQGWFGHVVLRSLKHPRVRIKMQVGGRAHPGPCPSTLSYTVTGGTGRFYHATGSGTVAFMCSGSAYSDQWSGTISF
jgi:hypothetical protein